MKKVLILGAVTVQADAIELLNEMGYETYVCAAYYGPGAETASHFSQIDFLDFDKVAHYIQENKIDAVYSVGSDLAMPVACELSRRLALPTFVGAETAYTCNHKNLMRIALTEKCKSNVPFQLFKHNDKLRIGFPAILKPSDSQGQRGIVYLKNQKDLDDNINAVLQYSKNGVAIAEKYIDGPEISVNGYLLNGEIKILVASDRITWPQYTGLIHKHIVPSVLLDEQTNKVMTDIVRDACKRIGITNGPVYLQIKLKSGIPYIIEITPRLDGCHMWNVLNRYMGVNLLKLTFRHLLEGDTSELLSQNSRLCPKELVFFCQEPHTRMVRSAFTVPDDSEMVCFYYKDGEIVKPVNGKYEKVGYYIRSLT